MKFIHTLAFLLLIGYIICDACSDVTDPSADNCKKITIADHHCCYYETPKLLMTLKDVNPIQTINMITLKLLLNMQKHLEELIEKQKIKM